VSALKPQGWAACAVILRHLSTFLARVRTERGLTMSAAGREIGISPATVHRIEHGYGCNTAVAERVLTWMSKTDEERKRS